MAISTRPVRQNEFWKSDGVLWDGIRIDQEYRVANEYVYCTNCQGELDRDGKCIGCGQAHRLPKDMPAAWNKASHTYRASKRRETYTVLAPQIGEKLAEYKLDLPDDKFMVVKLEKKDSGRQVVVTLGDKGVKDKSQIFIDLARNQIREDHKDQDPSFNVSSIALKNQNGEVTKSYGATATLEHPYLYVVGMSMTSATGGTSSFSIRNDEPESYFLESVQLGELSLDVGADIARSTDTNQIFIPGLHNPFSQSISTIKLIVSRTGRRFAITQKVNCFARADDQFNLDGFEQRPLAIEHIQ